MTKEKLVIFDTTMRDGEQSPGASMTKEDKIQIAKALELLRVDVMEAGFPAASPGDFESVKAVAQTVKESTVAGLARSVPGDIERCGEAVKHAARPRIHTFIATSPIHMEKKLQMHPDQVVEAAVKAVKQASKYTNDIEFSLEDAGRSEIDFMARITEAVIKAGATTINLPDTVGYNLPNQFANIVSSVMERTPNSDKAIFSVHCHDDLGLSVANSLAAVQAGARQVECTINGLGERAGNASLEEVVMAVRTRADMFDVETNIDTTQIMNCSRLVSSITGFQVQPNKAVVGANAFAHESGIHQDGVIKNRETYEIMRAQDIGLDNNKLVLGKHSGRNAVKTRLQELGVELDSADVLNEVFSRFKDLADKKHEIFDEDLIAISTDSANFDEEDKFALSHIEVGVSSTTPPHAKLTLLVDGKEVEAQGEGGGQVDAVYTAIESVVKSGAELELYSVNNITSGTDAQGEVSVRLSYKDSIVNGHGADTDIVVASAKAYLNALNKMEVGASKKIHPQKSGNAI